MALHLNWRLVAISTPPPRTLPVLSLRNISKPWSRGSTSASSIEGFSQVSVSMIMLQEDALDKLHKESRFGIRLRMLLNRNDSGE